MSALPRPDVTGPTRVLNDALHDLHHRAGWPSLRTLARQTGVSHTSVSRVFSTAALPSWGTVELLVQALGGNTSHFHELWLAASTPTNGDVHPAVPRIAGRRTELGVVRRHLEAGTGLLLVTGEAGIGKTTLVEAAAAPSSTFVAVGHCLPLSMQVPLMPMVDVLARAHAVDGGQWCTEALEECPGYARGTLARLLPELGVGAPAQDELGRQHLFTAVGRFLSALARLRPFAVLLEDLHWADSETLDLLEHLLAGPAPAALTATWRTDDPTVSLAHREWLIRVGRLAATSEIALCPLTADETREQLLLSGGIVDHAAAARIHARTGGHPLFTAHLAGQPPEAGLPRALADLLDLRMEGLRAAASSVASALGVADRGCRLDLLARTTGLAHQDLVEALRELDARRLLAHDAGETACLSHPLLAETARRRLVPGEAEGWHRALALALSASSDPIAAEVAEHWRHAGDPHAELHWRVVAARQAHACTAPAAEAQQWLRALEIHGAHPDAALDDIAARIAAFDALELAGEFDTTLEVLRPGMLRFDELDDLTAAGLLRRLAMAEGWLNDNPDVGLPLIDQALARLEPHGATAELVHALDLRANELMDAARDAEALVALGRALATCDALEDDDLYYGTSATLGWYKAHVGDLAGASAVFDEARARVPVPTDPRREAYMAMCHTDALIQHRRPAEEVMAAAQRAIELGSEWDMDFHLLTVTRANVVEALLQTGRVNEAAAIHRTLPISDKYDHWPVTWMAGEIAIAEGRLTDAIESFRGLEATGQTPVNRMHRAHGIAVSQVWLHAPQEAWDRLVPALDALLGQPVVARTGQAYATAARAGADIAELWPDRAREVAEALRSLRAGACMDPLGPAPAPIVREACTHVWDAELARTGRVDSSAQWVRAASSWAALRSPHDAAYCRWRAAQCALREGQGTVAARLLKRAAADAREHVPLSRAIATTSGAR
ncbi:MAG TPA: ATP-binding protein [Nocardioides sp.]|nr:ATP-binding protein [Nocardioides sp.]